MTGSEPFAVIMAGGGGTRLWPISRRTRPKQGLRLVGERTLFQMAVERLSPLIPPERILVVTVAELHPMLRRQAPALPESNFLLEPEPKGTAAAIGLAAIELRQRQPGAVMACLTADHYIRNTEHFRDLLETARQLAAAGGLVTLGIQPAYPSTAYGYIELGPRLAGEFAHPVHAAIAFREKPPAEVAGEYVQSGRFRWNSGMFIWTAERILEEIGRLMPELAQRLDRVARLPRGARDEGLPQIWRELRPETIDYGVMEKARGVVVVSAGDLGWWDVGSWDRFFEILEADGEGNILLAPRVLAHETRRSLIYQESPEAQTEPRLIATLGVEDVVVVDTGDIILVCSRDRAEEVKRLVERLEGTGWDNYL